MTPTAICLLVTLCRAAAAAAHALTVSPARCPSAFSSLTSHQRQLGVAGARLACVMQNLSSVLDSFPPVRHALAYGSGVFAQPGLYDALLTDGDAAAAGSSGTTPPAAASSSSADKPMLDFIFAVNDPVAWHTEVIMT